jgi:hypothetical protein
MKIFAFTASSLVLIATVALAQTPSFEITGTPIPSGLLQQNYGSIPKGISAYDLNICNVTDAKQPIVSSRIYQALSDANSSLEPIGRQIMLAAILRNQNHSLTNILGVILNSTTGIFSIVSSSKSRLPAGLMSGAAIGSLAGQQVLSSLRPILSADQLEKFEDQVLEPALVLDGGSCVERTVFVSSATSKAKIKPLTFHVH